MTWEEYQKKCYILSRQQEKLREEGRFDAEATVIIEDGLAFFGQQSIAFLESMIVRKDAYEEMDRKYCPILIYVGNPICYGVLDGFAKDLGEALARRGYIIEYFDPYGDKVTDIVTLMGKRFRAIIGIQTFVFSVKMKTGENVHDSIIGPKYNMFLDHPIWMREHMNGGPKDYTILTHDANYAMFVRAFFPQIRDVALIPPAGKVQAQLTGGTDTATEENVLSAQRDYDFSFIGSYHNWRLWIPQVKELNRQTKGLARRYMMYMLRHRNLPWEGGLQGLLQDICGEDGGAFSGAAEDRRQYAQKVLSDHREFENLLFDIKPVCFMVMSYLREKVLDTIVAAGIPMHLFSSSFIGTKYEGAPGVILHQERCGDDTLELYARSKVSLNIMSWHKAGMTERIANMMLNGAVMITDTSVYLEQEYVAGEDYVPFSLDEIESLSGIIRSIIQDEGRQETIRRSAYEKASKKETWDNRAERFIDILEQNQN
ncbi:MAG: glycosyltransferase family 1 protein [Lachnospiraceae bacterium]|nr:glycosyltransferase family 1 protein [Lachnospiraceae bacterium]